MKFIVYTDGASRGNPGHAAYGFTISEEKGKLLYEEGKYIGVTTNNVAEYTAVLEALRHIREFIPKGKSAYVELNADSKLVAEQLSGNYKIKSQHLKSIIEKILLLSSSFSEINFKHVRRAQNSRADRLANLALDKKLFP